MKNLKAHHHLALIPMLLFGVVSIWAWGTIVFATSSGTTIELTIGPPDECVNIPGHQTSMPTGMLLDSDGNCYTPPPTPIDLCTNIDGMQETLPENTYRNGTNCLAQTVPPKDLCPNLPATQPSVPEASIYTIDNTCLTPARDMCTNITGIQPLVPEQLERTNTGVCFTPSLNSGPTTPTPRGGTATDRDLKNVPSFFEPFIRPLVDAIPGYVKAALSSMPPLVAQTFPYMTFLVLAIAAGIMSWQAVRETVLARRVARTTKRERDIAEEKNSFLHLISHYLSVPLHEMKAATTSKPLFVLIDRLERETNEVASHIRKDTLLGAMQHQPKQRHGHLSFLRSTFFWFPVLLTLLIVWTSNFLLGVVGDVEIGTFNLLAQAGAFIVTALFFYGSIRTHFIRHQERAYREKELEREEALDHARNEFILRSTRVLTHHLANMSAKLELLNGSPKKKLFLTHYEHVTHLLERFRLLTNINTGVSGATEKFNLRTTVDELFMLYQPRLDRKHLTVINAVGRGNVTQRRSLFDFVMSSLLDEAIELSSPGSTVTITSSVSEHELTIEITDPESSAQRSRLHVDRRPHVMHLAYSGLGLGLSLDKSLMGYVGHPKPSH